MTRTTRSTFFQEEVRALYSPEDDGDRGEYWDAALEIFAKEYAFVAEAKKYASAE